VSFGADIFDGKDGRWVVEDLGDVQLLAGIVWVGVRKTDGKPSIRACSVTSASGQAFMRDNNPAKPHGPDPDPPHHRCSAWKSRRRRRLLLDYSGSIRPSASSVASSSSANSSTVSDRTRDWRANLGIARI
jgi:hypothetical protein